MQGRQAWTAATRDVIVAVDTGTTFPAEVSSQKTREKSVLSERDFREPAKALGILTTWTITHASNSFGNTSSKLVEVPPAIGNIPMFHDRPMVLTRDHESATQVVE